MGSLDFMFLILHLKNCLKLKLKKKVTKIAYNIFREIYISKIEKKIPASANKYK